MRKDFTDRFLAAFKVFHFIFSYDEIAMKPSTTLQQYKNLGKSSKLDFLCYIGLT